MYIVFTHASGDIYSAILVDYMHVMSRTYCNQPVFINNTLVVVLSVLHIIYDISWKGIPMVTLLVVYHYYVGLHTSVLMLSYVLGVFIEDIKHCLQCTPSDMGYT